MRRAPWFISQNPPGSTCVRFTWNARAHRHADSFCCPPTMFCACPPDSQNTGYSVSYREWRNAARRMIPVTDWYPRHCDAPVGLGSMAFDVFSVPTGTTIDAKYCAVQRWQALKPMHETGVVSRVPCRSRMPRQTGRTSTLTGQAVHTSSMATTRRQQVSINEANDGMTDCVKTANRLQKYCNPTAIELHSECKSTAFLLHRPSHCLRRYPRWRACSVSIARRHAAVGNAMTATAEAGDKQG